MLEPSASTVAMKYRLRYQSHDIELVDGEFVVGRGSDCQLALDDALVSRRHAMLIVGSEDLHIEDLASRNGVWVNGDKIDARRKLTDGDRVKIGSQEMAVLRVNRVPSATLAQPAPTLRADAFGLLGGLAEKALAMGRGEEAERILSVHMTNILDDAKSGRNIAPDTAKIAALYAVKLGSATGKSRWIDYVFDLYSIGAQPCPAEVIDELYAGARKVKGIDVARLRSYVELLKNKVKSPAERFLLNRLEGLEPLILK
ncbi:MAG TPA: FHA domain-containing protein [Polyangiaceae bacterium]|nr:FHA domain-containing protein [Polyangiaceae bacterium]